MKDKKLYECNNKNDFNRHLSTTKHKRLTNTSYTLTKKTLIKNNCILCGKVFKHRQSLYNHKKTCNFLENGTINYMKNTENEINDEIIQIFNNFDCLIIDNFENKIDDDKSSPYDF